MPTKRTLHRLFATMLAAAPLLLAQPASSAEKNALLVAVSDYPSLPLELHLRGPRNDVPMMAHALGMVGYRSDHIRVLADGVIGAGQPTRAAIFAELSKLADDAKPGDEITVLFAMHGSRQPARPADIGGRSRDGYDAILLPIDIGKWESSTAAVENAIVSYEISAWLDKVRAKGAFVWMIFDACHSANMTRGGTERGRSARAVAPDLLGIPPEALVRAGKAAASRGGPPAPSQMVDQAAPPRPGEYAAFFAAQADEQAPEYELPRYHHEAKQHGLLSYALARAIAANPRATYGRLADQILTEYAMQNESSATPAFAGTGLNRGLEGQESAASQWPVTEDDGKITLAAGSLQGVAAGARLRLYGSGVASDDKPIGAIEVTAADLLSSQARLVVGGRSAIPEGAFARLDRAPLDLSLRVAVPAEDGPSADLFQQVRRKFDGGDKDGFHPLWVAPGEPADLRLALTAGGVAILPPDGGSADHGALQIVPFGATPEASFGALQGALLDAARSLNLLRLTGGLTRVSPLIKAELTLLSGNQGSAIAPPAGQVTELRAGDRFRLKLTNLSDESVDVTLFEIAPELSITLLFPYAGELNRIEAHGVATLPPKGDLQMSATTAEGGPAAAGWERLLLLALPAIPGQRAADFSFLAERQPSLKRGEPTTAEAALRTATFSRGAMRGTEDQGALSALRSELITFHFTP